MIVAKTALILKKEQGLKNKLNDKISELETELLEKAKKIAELEQILLEQSDEREAVINMLREMNKLVKNA